MKPSSLLVVGCVSVACGDSSITTATMTGTSTTLPTTLDTTPTSTGAATEDAGSESASQGSSSGGSSQGTSTEGVTSAGPGTTSTTTTSTSGSGTGSSTGDPGPVCGNGVVEPGEECDDADDLDKNQCSNMCTKVPCDQQEGGLDEVLSYIWISNSSQGTVSKIDALIAANSGEYGGTRRVG